MCLTIEMIQSFVPQTAFTLHNDYHQLGLNAQEAVIYGRFYGIERIPVMEESMLNALVKVTEPILQTLSQQQKQQIRYVIMVRTAPQVTPFSTAMGRLLLHRLQLMLAVSYTLNLNKCVSILNALDVCHTLLKQDTPDAMALIVAGESVFTQQNRILPNISITGDGVAAALVKFNGSGHRLIAAHTKTLGEYAKGVWMDLTQVAEFGARFESTLYDVALHALQQAGLSWNDITLILPHNVNLLCWKNFARFAHIPLEKIYLENIQKTSHCFNADLLMNAHCVLQEKRLHSGDYYMMATVGVGAVFGVSILQVP